MSMVRFAGAACALLLLPVAASAAEPFALTVDSIMRGPKLVGHPPSDLRWSGDSKRLYFEWKQPGEDEAATWLVERKGGEPRRLSDAERLLAPPTRGEWDAARRRVLWIDRGDVVLLDTVTGQRRELTRTAAAESDPHFAQGERAVTFVRDGGLYLLPLEGAGGLVQLAEAGPKKEEPKLTNSQNLLRDEEARLLVWVAEAKRKREKREAEEKARALPRIDLTPKQSIRDVVLVPGDRYAVFLVDERGDGKVADVPRYVSESGYTEPVPTRNKVGDSQNRQQVVILDLHEKVARWVKAPFAAAEPAPGAAPAPSPTGGSRQAEPDARALGGSVANGRSSAPEPPSGGEAVKAAPPKPEPTVQWRMPLVSRDGAHVIADVRSTDYEQRWIVRLDLATGLPRVLFHERDEAWLRFFFGGAELGLLPDSRQAFLLSERSGFMHLYALDLGQERPEPRPLTSGAWEITDLALGADGRTFLIESTEAGAAERHVYTMPVDGGPRTRLTTKRGAWSVAAAPDGQWAGWLHSTGNRPPEVHVGALKSGAAAVAVTRSPSAAWLAGPWLDPEVVHFTARDGVKVPARLYTPEMLGATRDPARPAVVFVHGAGYLQNAHHYWSDYYREYMFHHLLASRGYVVLDVDYRASAGYGRAWRTAIYRHMGGKDLDDIVDGATYLVDAHGVAKDRIGVYGGSYGGFITLMALFTSPDTFAAGAALRPVTDWAHYNHPYTANILNEPQQDLEAYRRSSPIHFAEGLKGALLICHGMMDINVHFQDSVRLAQRLIELRKENWELAAYPVEDHGFVEETAWADEYKRILKLFETHLRSR
ncbi:MAG: prolyl oligopeptidase family serine peptidase [Vicinamibacteria bacterium]|nr:prolyl oligopeptidase family serine peptidase [Vicinamibacteria bacterium]